MRERFKILLAIILPIMCITSLCISFLMISNDNKTEKVEKENVPVNKTRYEANYFAMADETSPAQGQSTSYKGGAVFLEPDSTFIMIGGTIQNHTNTYGGAIFISEGATFTMDGGTITGCSATYGGAIYVSAGGTCNINAGTITGNTANYGPSIYAEEGAIVNISADTVIDENSVELNKKVSISTDTIVVGAPHVGMNMHYMDFGSYPQTYVGDSFNDTLESWYLSNPSAQTPIKTHRIGWDTSTSMELQKSWEFYTFIDGKVYARGVGVPFAEDTTYLSGETVGGTGVNVWFKVEPIRWVVLNYNSFVDGTAETLELMSYFALTGNINFYETTNEGNSWENSIVREWLNGEFYNTAFTPEEKEGIALSTVKNNLTGSVDYNGVSTQDNVYLMSYREFEYGEIFSNYGPYKGLCSPTDFALSNYCYKETSTNYVTATYPNGGTCYYWSRSAGTYSYCVYSFSYFSGMYDHSVAEKKVGTRPVIRLVL